MSKSKQIEQLVSFFLFAGLFSSLFFVYFAQERVFESGAAGGAPLGSAKFIRIFSVLCIFITTLFSLFVSKTKYHYSIYFAFFILITTITLNYFISGASLGDPTQLMSTKGIGTWFCLGLIFVGYHDKRYANFKKFMLFSVLIISLLSFYNLLDYGVGFWRGQALSKYRVYATNLVWITPYVFLILKHNEKLKKIRLLVLCIGIILTLIIQTRSFLLIYLFTIIFDFYHTKNKTNYIVFFIAALFGMIYLVANSQALSSSLELLINRGTTDTRSEQLEVFVSQLNFFELVTGKGYFSTYSFGNKQWAAVDNQWLYLMWWGGLIPVSAYFYISAVIPLKLLMRGNLAYETKVECFVLVLWILALFGLAIFTTIIVDLFFFIICVIQGRVLYKYSSI